MCSSDLDRPPVLQVRGAFVAATIADWFRAKGKDVLFFMDSVTRLAMAQRQIGLSAGEPPTTKGYTPSVFSLLPRLLERAGASESGTITGIYTVLIDGDDSAVGLVAAVGYDTSSKGFITYISPIDAVQDALQVVVADHQWA